MQSRIEQLTERIKGLNNIIGTIDFDDIAKKQQQNNSVYKDKITNISDIIIKLQNEIIDNDNITLKEVHKKCIFFIKTS